MSRESFSPDALDETRLRRVLAAGRALVSQLEVVDDGQGFAVDQPTEGFGLIGIPLSEAAAPA